MAKEPIGWFTANGRHIPIMEGETKDEAIKNWQIERNKQEAKKLNKETGTNVNHYKQHADVVKQLSSDKYSDGTYDTRTLEPVEFDKGYQFTFCQIGDNYSESEYNALVNGILSKLENKNVFAGKFEGSPEISFYTEDKDFAVEIGRRYNQISIWDWGACDEVKTGGTGRKK